MLNYLLATALVLVAMVIMPSGPMINRIGAALCIAIGTVFFVKERGL